MYPVGSFKKTHKKLTFYPEIKWEVMSPQMSVQAPGRTVFFLTEFQISGMLEALRLELLDRVRSFRSMEGSVSGDSLGNYRLALSVELSDEEGD